MTWKYQADLEKVKYFKKRCSVLIYSDDWELYNQLVKAVETVIGDGDVDD
jgi:hypothetical protein